MFSNSSNSSPGKDTEDNSSANVAESPKVPQITIPTDTSTSGEKRANGNSSPGGRKAGDEPGGEKKRRSSGVAKARDMFATAKQSLHFYGSSPTSSQLDKKTSQQKYGKGDVALHVTQGSLNNSAGDSNPGPYSTFRVGVTEDKNKKCRRTMEDTHAYLYNFLSTPAPTNGPDSHARPRNLLNDSNQNLSSLQPVESDNGYFAIFDGHAGNFAADWCGKKLHVLLEENIRKQPSTPVPELLDQTFTSVDQQLEKLPVKNSGCTAVIAVLRWEDRIPNSHSVTGSTSIAPAVATSLKASSEPSAAQGQANETAETEKPHGDGGEAGTQNVNRSDEGFDTRLRDSASRQRVLYTANVGDARIVLCRNGRALRLSYDHKGSDENEGKRVANAGGLILNNRVNGVLAVTRALGDSYMKDLVTGHPYTTETVIQPDQDEFLILACDGLWDVCSDQEAVDLIRQIDDPQAASKVLVDHALSRFSTDNLSCMIVRFDNKAVKQQKQESSVGVDNDPASLHENVSETDAILLRTKAQLDEDGDATGTVTPDVIAEENVNEDSEVDKQEAQSKS